jgi:hypothetical protein
MMRVSPFGKTGKAMPTADRVNLWPGLYHSGDQTSIVWPIVDIDKEGFAVRPVINKEGDDWSIFFPLSGWNTKEKEGWALTAYVTDDNKGVFPLFNSGDEFDYYGPFWKSEESKGVFPVYATGRFNQLTLAYWYKDKNGKVEWFGVCPVYHLDINDEGRTHTGLCGAIHFETNKQGHHNWVFPLWVDREEGDERSRAVIPFYWLEVDGDRTHVFTLFGDWYEDGDTRGLNVYPLWFAHDKGDDRKRLLVPVYYSQREGDRNLFITPLGGRGWHTNGETYMTNIAGPLYHHSAEGDQSYTAFVWPIFQHEKDGDSTWTSLFPVFQFDKTPESTIADLALIAQMRQEKGEDSWLLWPAISVSDKRHGLPWRYDLTLAGSLGDETNSRRHIAGSLGVALDKRKTEKYDRWDLDFLLFGGAGKTQHVPDPVPSPPRNWSQNLVESSHLNLIAYNTHRYSYKVWKTDTGLTDEELATLSYWASRNDKGFFNTKRDIASAVAVLKKAGIDVDPDQQSIQAGVLKFAEGKTTTRDTLNAGVPMVFRYRQSGEGVEWDALMSALSYDREGERSSLSVLRYLYHTERDGDAVTRDIFPFIQWDGGADSAHRAFLWRLLSYERDGAKSGGHVFFIPWGER